MRPLALTLTLACCLFPAAALAGEVEMELVTEPDFPALDQQDWFRLLTGLKVANLRIRPAAGGDKAEIVARGTKANPVYAVTGVLKRTGELVVPGGRFKLSDKAGLSKWLEELKTFGPQGSPEGKPLYGLSANQFADIKADLAKKVVFGTKGLTRSDAVNKIRETLKVPSTVDPQAAKAMADKVEVDVSGLSAGTALAYLLRPAGLAMRPERLPSGELRYVIAAGTAVTEPWPVGWPMTKRRQEVLPQMFEVIPVEIEEIPLRQALEVIAERSQLPVLLDENNLARHEIDIDKAAVSFPNKKSTYSLVLTRLLGQARLQYEIRIDEADKPFMWVTTIKK